MTKLAKQRHPVGRVSTRRARRRMHAVALGRTHGGLKPALRVEARHD